jgi:hypothetical protein
MEERPDPGNTHSIKIMIGGMRPLHERRGGQTEEMLKLKRGSDPRDQEIV